MVSDKIFFQLFLLIPFFIYSQTDAQIREINNRNLDINSLKNIWGGLDLNDGDGSSYRNFIDGNYNDNKYLTDVYVYYVSKLFSGAKNGELNFADLSETKRKELVLYFVKNIDIDTILYWEEKEWTYSKILIENIDLWEFLVKFN